MVEKKTRNGDRVSPAQTPALVVLFFAKHTISRCGIKDHPFIIYQKEPSPKIEKGLPQARAP